MNDPDRTSRLLDRLMPCPSAPHDLHVRVLGASERGSSHRWPWLMAAAALLVVAGAVAWHPRGEVVGGPVRAGDRETLRVADRAVAVIEPGGEIAWRLSAGALRVEQRRGDVFYRADAPMSVVSSAGEVVVTGTCFRVALRGPTSAYVQVLEGSVDLRNGAGQASLVAGEWGLLMSGRQPVRLPAAASHPPFALDQPFSGPGLRPVALVPAPPPTRTKAFAFTPEEHLAMARRCEFRWGLPRHITRWEAPGPDDRADLTPDERSAVAKILEEDRAQYFEQIHQIYTEVTGEDRVDATLSALALHHEIDSRAGRAEGKAVRQRILQEWAGDVAPPANRSGLSPIERFWRLQTGTLDELSRKLAVVIGADRAGAFLRASVDMAATGKETGCPSGR